MRKCLCVAIAVAAAMSLPVSAKPFQKTKYKFYSINGNTPGEIYNSMIRRGPDVNGVNAYASTSATSSQDGKLIQKGKSCRVDSYTFNINFTINLPKLKNEAALTGQTSAKWGQFKSFLKTHEETHRSIWLDCAQTLEAQVGKLQGKTCKDIDNQAAMLWKKMRKTCDARHAAFDASEQRRLIRHPFVKLVLNRSVTSTKGLKVQ
jgi:predicted secreted Zn-dependent protease